MQALEDNGVWKIVKAPESARPLDLKWVFKTKREAGGDIERLKRAMLLMACGNE